MNLLSLPRKFLLLLALPCWTAVALADVPAPVTPPGSPASATAAQGGPVVRSHGHAIHPSDKIRRPLPSDPPVPAATDASGSGK